MSRQQSLVETLLTVGTSPQAVGSGQVLSVSIFNILANGASIFVGDSSGQNAEVLQGECYVLEVDKLDLGTQGFIDLSSVYVRGANAGMSVVVHSLRGA